MFLFLVDGNRDLDDPTDRTHAGLFRGFILRNSDVGAAALTLDVFLFRMVCGNHIIWGFQHVAGFRRRHVGASIQTAWTTSLDGVRAALDADTANDRTLLLRATSQELGATRDAVLDTAVRRLDMSQKQAAEAYTLAEQHETNPRSIWGYVQGLTRLSQRTPWQDGRYVARSRRQSPPHHGPLTLVLAERAHPRWPSHTHRNHAGGPGPPHLPARVRSRAPSFVEEQPCARSVRPSSTSTATSKRPLRAKQQLDAERWRTELRPRAMRLFAARTAKLTWSRALVKLVVEELYPDDLFTELVGRLDRVPPRQWPHVLAIAVALRHSWRRDGLTRVARRLRVSLATSRDSLRRQSRRHTVPDHHERRFSGSPRPRQGSPLRSDPAGRGSRP